MKKINRTIVGIIAIVAAAVIAFVIAPGINKISSKKIAVVRVKENITKGHVIAKDDVEIAYVLKNEVSEDLISITDDVVGKFAKCDMFPGDYVSSQKVSENSLSASDVLSSLDGEKRAISITVQSFAGGLSGKLENGDIVEVVVYKDELSEIYPELKYIKVITTTTSDGVDKDFLVQNEDGTYEQPITATLLVNEEQAKMLVTAENNGKIHLILVYRGDAEKSNEFLEAQDCYFSEKQKAENSKVE